MIKSFLTGHMRAAAATTSSTITAPLKDPRIVITKSARRADLYSGGKLVKTYKIALGLDPIGTKTRKGDRRTPEGHYRICIHMEHPNYIFLGLNYPSTRDAEAGLKRGAITKKEALAIAEAERKHQRPPWDTPLSGAIGLHSGGTESDWTWGCIALDNRDMEELRAATRHWTPVEVRP